MYWKGKPYYTAVNGGNVLELPNDKVWEEKTRQCHDLIAAFNQGSWDMNIQVDCETFGPRWRELGEIVGYFPQTPEHLTNSGNQKISSTISNSADY